VPGGLGPLTNAILMQHLLRAARDLARETPRALRAARS
jgi:5,10-methylene-tetrahydrofolate dehydrogenase/methenyl tetrahydrofolate cyclohydrolase